MGEVYLRANTTMAMNHNVTLQSLRDFNPSATDEQAEQLTHQRIIQGFAEHFSQYQWTHFVTLTFKEVVRKDAAAQRSRSITEGVGYRVSPVNKSLTKTYAQHKARAFIRQIEQRTQQPVDYFGSVEGGQDKRVHVHLVLNIPTSFTGEQLECIWERNGKAHVKRYDVDSGHNGIAYIAKSLPSRDSVLLLSKNRRAATGHHVAGPHVLF